MRRYTDEEKAFLFENCAGRQYQELADLFEERFGVRRTSDAIAVWIRKHGHTNGLDCKFKEGRIQPGANIYVRGCTPHNHCKVGERRTKNGYVFVKVDDKRGIKNTSVNWVPEHVLVWTEANGPVPKGFVVRHINGDKSDNRLENLVCISRNVAIYTNRNGLSEDPAIRETQLLMAEVSAKIYERKKNK